MDRGDDRKRRADRALGIVLMGVRITGIDQHAVAEILRDRAVEAADEFRGAAMEGGDDGPQILGIEPAKRSSRPGRRTSTVSCAAPGGVAAGILDRGWGRRPGQLQRNARNRRRSRVAGIQPAQAGPAEARRPQLLQNLRPRRRPAPHRGQSKDGTGFPTDGSSKVAGL